MREELQGASTVATNTEVREKSTHKCKPLQKFLAIKLAGEKHYGAPRAGHGTLEGRRVMTILDRSARKKRLIIALVRSVLGTNPATVADQYSAGFPISA